MKLMTMQQLRGYCTREAMLAGGAAAGLDLLNYVVFPSHGSLFRILYGAVAVGFLGSTAGFLLSQYKLFLKERSEAGTDIVWDVEVNGVKVGDITDALYAGFRLKVFSDRASYFYQFVQIAKIICHEVFQLFYKLPVLILWFLVISEIFFPDYLNSVLSAFKSASPTELHGMFATAGILLQTYIIGLTFIALFFPSFFGVTNRFDEETGKLLRRYCKVAANGDIKLIRWESYYCHFNSEMGRMLKHSRERRAKLAEAEK